ncbi:hypothetical protein TL16_g13222, partial [Triparma laevis f. inornata]
MNSCLPLTQIGAPTIIKRFELPQPLPHSSILSVLQSPIHAAPPIIATLPSTTSPFTLSHINIDDKFSAISIPTLFAPFPPSATPQARPHQIETITRPHHPLYKNTHNAFTKSTSLPFNHFFNRIYVATLTPSGDFSVYSVSPTEAGKTNKRKLNATKNKHPTPPPEQISLKFHTSLPKPKPNPPIPTSTPTPTQTIPIFTQRKHPNANTSLPNHPLEYALLTPTILYPLTLLPNFSARTHDLLSLSAAPTPPYQLSPTFTNSHKPLALTFTNFHPKHVIISSDVSSPKSLYSLHQIDLRAPSPTSTPSLNRLPYNITQFQLHPTSPYLLYGFTTPLPTWPTSHEYFIPSSSPPPVLKFDLRMPFRVVSAHNTQSTAFPPELIGPSSSSSSSPPVPGLFKPVISLNSTPPTSTATFCSLPASKSNHNPFAFDIVQDSAPPTPDTLSAIAASLTTLPIENIDPSASSKTFPFPPHTDTDGDWGRLGMEVLHLYSDISKMPVLQIPPALCSPPDPP